MAQISLWGANYSDVPAVELPKTGGGTSTFTDVTDTTAAAEDVAQGKYFYTSAGVKAEGTASPSASFETGTITGDGLNTNTRNIPTSKKWTNFAIFCRNAQNQTRTSGKYWFVGAYGNASEYNGIGYNGSGPNSFATTDLRGVYLKFFDDRIQLMPVTNGGYCYLVANAIYDWIAW